MQRKVDVVEDLDGKNIVFVHDIRFSSEISKTNDHNNVEAYKDGCKHINLAANVCGYTPINLGKLIKEGVLFHIFVAQFLPEN